jgi:hypothetical protein
LCEPFPRYSNLHHFIQSVIEDLFFEEPDGNQNYFIYDF